MNFAALHLSPRSFPSLLLLSGAADALYLRTHNLLPPLLLHCLWNASQLLAIAFLGKQEFV
jgi:membrane protease YdiL (CAAX protease family)